MTPFLIFFSVLVSLFWIRRLVFYFGYDHFYLLLILGGGKNTANEDGTTTTTILGGVSRPGGKGYFTINNKLVVLKREKLARHHDTVGSISSKK